MTTHLTKNKVEVTIVSESYSSIHVVARNGKRSVSIHTNQSRVIPQVGLSVHKKHDPFAKSNWAIHETTGKAW